MLPDISLDSHRIRAHKRNRVGLPYRPGPGCSCDALPTEAVAEPVARSRPRGQAVLSQPWCDEDFGIFRADTYRFKTSLKFETDSSKRAIETRLLAEEAKLRELRCVSRRQRALSQPGSRGPSGLWH